jgi:hypothetical protein
MPISDVPEIVGWTTFTIEHLIYGFLVGVGWFLAQPRTKAALSRVRDLSLF